MPQFRQWNKELWICNCGYMMPECSDICTVCQKHRYATCPRIVQTDTTLPPTAIAPNPQAGLLGADEPEVQNADAG